MENKSNICMQIATDELTEIISITEICRICANQEDKLVGIYNEDGENNDLYTKINLYLPIKVDKSDELPLQCCWQCTSTILAWHELFLTSIEADQRLRSYQIVPEKQLDIEESYLEQTESSCKSDLNNDSNQSNHLESDSETAEQMKTSDSQPQNLEDEKVNVSYKNCIVCTQSFSTKTKLKNHLWEVHKMKPPELFQQKNSFSCSVCNKNFTRKFDMQRHILRKHPETSIEPSVRCKNLEKANRCKIIEPNETYYKCDICQTKFKTSSAFIPHYNIHLHEKLHCCHICGKKFQKSSHLRRHLDQIHYGIKYSCELCDQKFTSKTTKEEHLNTHTNNRPYMCDTCGKAFRQSSSLYVHKLFHRNVFPYGCNICDKKFRRKGELKKHTFIHTGERQFSCVVCKRPFRLRQDLKRHMKIHGNTDLMQ